ncbi:MAG: diadenylate cyclase CdaA [Lachnospiraceae bacterium]|jgi:diadenylate cyclase|nr:diadenylate cyclase CdaA [Lachnospiraceae bacterium]MCR5739773.1 diadenylate cyclase CdaA [Lachnospiraceae bacterium]
MQFIEETIEYLKSFGTYISTIEWQDYAEIIIIAVLLYYMMRWMHNTRAWSLMKGLVVILVFIIIANVFHMDTILWLSSNILQFAVIALIVVLQPELRKALETLGKSNIIGGLFYFVQQSNYMMTLSEKSIDEIARACYLMGEERTGALIVIENQESLSRVDESGIKVDAEITSQLLLNIFKKNTPLHDGAVTVRHNRISCATCYLPLTSSMSLSKEFGTRHRAGLGISEESDAIVIIVSEETGRISVARDGQLERNLSETSLKRLLMHAFGENSEEAEKQQGKIRRRRKS